MIDQLILQLESPDAEQRRQAIIALGKSQNPAALPHLARIYRNDPEQRLRDLARRAGAHIQQARTAGTGGTAAASTPAPRQEISVDVGDDIDEPDLDALLGVTAPPARKASRQPPAPKPAEPEPPPRPVAPLPVRGQQYETTREMEKRAREYVESALSMNIRGDNAKAMKLLAQALEINPNLVNDGYFMNLAGNVTGLEGDGAVQMILDSQQRQGFVRSVEEQKRKERIDKHLSEAKSVTWTSTWFEIILFTLIISIGPLLLTLVTVESARAYINSMPAEIASSPQMQPVLESLSNYNVSSLLIVGVLSGIGGVISLLVQTVFIHYCSTLLLGGHGTLRYMLELLLGFYNKWLPILFFISYIATAVTFISGFSPVAICAVLPVILLSLYVSGKTSGKIGEAYDFGAAKGCIAYFAGSIIIAVISFVISLFAAQTFGVALQNLIPQM